VQSLPDVTIVVTVKEGRLSLEFRTQRGAYLSLPLGLSTLKVAEIRRSLAAGLRRFVATIARTGKVKKDPQLAIEALRQLYAVGTEVGFNIFKTHGVDVQDFFTRALPGWRRTGEKEYVAPWVELEGPIDYPLPLEFVPLFDTSEPDWRNEAAMIQLAARFPGFSTIFTRTVSDREFGHDDDPLENSPALIVRLFRHAGLTGAESEERNFRAARGIDLRGPWPTDVLSPDEFVNALTIQLYEARSPDERNSNSQPDHVQHFMCHCDTETPLSRDYSLTLAHSVPSMLVFKKPLGRTATLARIQSLLFGRPLRHRRAAPLVFLNACGSSKVTSDGVTSFPGLFLDLRSRGVIGTETAVPDLAAAEFARIFYEAFLRQAPLGLALHNARITLLQSQYNPVGIL
jgi:hypothetical protein